MEVTKNAFKELVRVTHKDQWFELKDFGDLFLFALGEAGIKIKPNAREMTAIFWELLQLEFIEHDKYDIFRIKIRDKWYDQPV